MNPMRMPLSPPRPKTAAVGLLLCAGVLLAACTSDQSHEYLAHSDRVTSGAGDATASNSAMHTINPWSAPSHKTQIDMDGKRAGLATKRYQTNTSVKPKGMTTDSGSTEYGAKD
jgi:Tfp pilus assembly protein PilX